MRENPRVQRKTKALGAVAGAIALAILLGASSCDESTRDEQYRAQDAKSDKRAAPDVSGDTEYENYIAAQKLYDDKSSIIWCTASFSNATVKPFTVPIAGKLTSSSVSYFPNQRYENHTDGGVMVENKSVDGMYHGSPPPYRYGFTPGGQYVDFSGMEVFCSTSLTAMQKSTLSVTNGGGADSVTKQAEEKLKAGDAAGAQALLDGISE